MMRNAYVCFNLKIQDVFSFSITCYMLMNEEFSNVYGGALDVEIRVSSDPNFRVFSLF